MEQGRVRYRSMVADSARWDGFGLRPDDIIISTPAKCGTTWMQMICALLVFQSTDLYEPLDLVSPWLDVLLADRATVVARLEAQQHRRFIKTHTPLDGLPFDDAVTYIGVVRDPRDVALSWDNHMTNMDFVAFLAARQNAVGLEDIAELLAGGPPLPLGLAVDRFWAWVENPNPIASEFSLASMLHHVGTLWEVRERPNVVLVRYEDLKADLGGQMRRIADRLGIVVRDDLWPALVDAATFDRMRRRAAEVTPEITKSLWLDSDRFFHRGTSGQWRDLLDDEDLRRYAAAVAALAPPDLAAWIHHEALPA